jgi:hypothetical protein
VPIFGGVSKTVRRFRVEGPLGESNRQDIVEGLKEYAKRHPNCAKLEFVSFLAGPTASVELYGRFGLLHTATCVDELADALASEFHPLDTHLDGGRLFLGDLPTPTLPETPVVAPEAPQPLKKGKVDSNYLYVAAGRQKGQGTKPKTLKGLYEVVLRPRASHANEREALRLENFPLARLGTTILGFNHSLQPSGTSVELLRYDEAPPTLKVYVKVGEGSPATVLRKVVALLETVHIDALAGGARYRLEA